MNDIILIEDQEKFADDFTVEAQSKNINIAHKRSFDGLKKLLPQYKHKFAAVILDIKCLLRDNQEMEDANFIGTAMSYLDQTVPGFPRFILTGDDTEFNTISRYYTNEKLFLKIPQDLEKLFNAIRFCIDNSENLRIKREHASIFEVFENGWIDDVGEQLLLNIIKGLTEKNPTQFKGILANIRSMQELIYKTINVKNKNVVPDGMFQKSNGMIKFNDLMKHLSGYPDHTYRATKTIYQNNTIANLTQTIYWSCGEYIHEDRKRIYFISDNTIKSLTYGLLEIMLWSKQYLK